MKIGMEAWNNGYQVVLSEDECLNMMVRGGLKTRLTELIGKAEQEKKEIKRILIRDLTGYQMMGIKIVGI